MEYPTDMEKKAHLLGNVASLVEMEARKAKDEENKVRDMIDAIDDTDLIHKGTPSEKYLLALDVVRHVLGEEFRNKLAFLAHEALYGDSPNNKERRI
jgi:hypothetical protein